MSKTVLKGSELTRELLKSQKYVLCYCSDTNEDDCRKYKNMRVVTCFEDGYFYTGRVDDPFVGTWKHAVPIDNNGNEIVEV